MDELLSVALLPLLRKHHTGQPLLSFQDPCKFTMADTSEHEMVLHHLVRYHPSIAMNASVIRDGLKLLDERHSLSGDITDAATYVWATKQARGI